MAKKCSKCGREMGFLEDDFDGLCFECNQSLNENRVYSSDSFLDNPVAKKFTLVEKFIKFIGYASAIIACLASAFNGEIFIRN